MPGKGWNRNRARAASCFAAALLFAPARAQDAARLERGLDDLRYQMTQFDAELAKLRKSMPAAIAKPARSRADSLLPGLAARLDSLTKRMAALEGAKPEPVPAAAPKAVASAPDPAPPAAQVDSGETAALRRELRALTDLLIEARTAAAPVRVASASALPPVPEPPHGVTAPVPSPAALPAGAAAPSLNLTGDIQIQGERRLATGSKQDNLDDFWGRVNLGAEYNGPAFQSKANIRIFPEGFGFEPLTGATFDTAGQGALKTQTQPSSKVLVNHAWVRFAPGPAALRLGRFETQESQSATYGNYIDLGPSGRFLARPAVHNAAEATWTGKGASTSVLFGSGDRKLDRGFLRAVQKVSGPRGLQAELGYRANLFDRVKDPDAEILQRFDAMALAPLGRGWNGFAEAAVLQAAGAPDQTPLLLGLRPPTGRYLDALSVEMEWLPDRKAAGRDKEMLFNLYARKVWGRARLEAGIASDAADPDANAFTTGLRVTSSLK